MCEVISSKNVSEIVNNLRAKGYQLDMIPSDISSGVRSSFSAILHSGNGGMLGSRNEPGVKVAIYDLGNSRRVELEALSTSPMGQKFNLKKGEQLCDQLYAELNEGSPVREPQVEEPAPVSEPAYAPKANDIPAEPENDDFSKKFMKGFKKTSPAAPSAPVAPEPTPVSVAGAAAGFKEMPKPDYVKREKCGKVNIGDSRFCGNCGSQRAEKKEEKPTPPSPGPDPKPGPNKKIIIIAAAVVLALVVAIPVISKMSSSPSYDDEYYDDGSYDESYDDESYDDEPYDEQSSIPDNAEEYEGHYYLVIDNPAYWSTAKEDCESRGGHLATITSQGEQDFIARLIENNGSQYNYWIGGTDEGQEGTWTWITGEPWTYSNWYKNQPDNGDINKERGGEGDHNYLQIGCGSDEDIRYMKWWDMSDTGVSSNFTDYPNYKDTQYFGYVCEWE